MLDASTCPVAFLLSEARHVTNATDAVTELEFYLKRELPSSIALAVALLMASLFVLLLGNRLVKPTLFVTSFFAAAIGALLVLPAIIDAAGLDDTAACITVAVAPVALGLVAAGASLCFLTLGFALLGAGSGAGLGYIAYAAALQRVPLVTFGSTNLMFVLAISIGAAIGMVVLLKQRTAIMIVATSLAGASGATPAVVLLLAHANIHFLGAFNSNLDAPPKFVWPQAILALVLFVVGLLVQCRLDGRKRAKTEALRSATVPLIVP